MIQAGDRIAIFLEGALGELHGKMGYGVLRYLPNEVVCVIDSRFAGQRVSDVIHSARDCDIVCSVEDAIALGANVLILGIAPPGGRLPAAWRKDLERAIASGISIVNGLHEAFAPQFATVRDGQWIWDIRQEPADLPNGSGAAATLSNRRILMVGTDMAIGKMTAGLELYRWLRERGESTAFVATGQIGITLTGRGVPLDAVRVDYASGAIEREVMACAEADTVIIEGQGSIVHPASTATLPLMRGSMPTHLILCHRAGQTHLARVPKIAIPPLNKLIDLYEQISEALGTFPRAQTIGVCLNTAEHDDKAARAACETVTSETGLPCTDPVRFGDFEPMLRLAV